MRKLSEARLSFLAHEIVRVLRAEGLAEIKNDRFALAEIKRLLNHDHESSARIDAIVRQKIASISRRIPTGSREWDVLYRQYFAEELRRVQSKPS